MAATITPKTIPPAYKSTLDRKKQERSLKGLTRKVVSKHRARQGYRRKPLSFARFASELNQCVQHLGLSVTYQAVKNWEDGVNRPDYFFILQLVNHAPEGSWQRAFAMDILAVQWPDLYQPGSEIGSRILKEINVNKQSC